MTLLLDVPTSITSFRLPFWSLDSLLSTLNQVLHTGILPDSRREAILPIPKPGKDSTTPASYRRKALTSCICKTMEQFVNDRLVWLLEKTNLLLPFRAVFVNKEALSIIWFASKLLVVKLSLTSQPSLPWIAHLSHFPPKMNSTFFVPIVQTYDPRDGASFNPRSIIWIKLIKAYIPKVKALSLPVSEKKNFEVGLLCSYFPTCDPGRWVNFDPRGIIWIQLITVYKEKLNTKYQSSTPSSFREEFQNGGASFDPQDMVWTNLKEVQTEMLTTKYQSSNPSSLRQEEFWSWYSLILCSNCDPKDGASLDPRGIIWINLVEAY